MPTSPDEPPFITFHELRWLRDQLESKSSNGAGPRVITVDQLLAFLQDLPDEMGDGNGH